jgi:hypothetical protein
MLKCALTGVFELAIEVAKNRRCLFDWSGIEVFEEVVKHPNASLLDPGVQLAPGLGNRRRDAAAVDFRADPLDKPLFVETIDNAGYRTGRKQGIRGKAHHVDFRSEPIDGMQDKCLGRGKAVIGKASRLNPEHFPGDFLQQVPELRDLDPDTGIGRHCAFMLVTHLVF